MSEVKAIPAGYEGVTPYLICKNAEGAIDFYKRAFGAVELFRIGSPGMVGHAELKIGNAIFMMADEHPQMGIHSPETVGGTPVHLLVYVADVDAFAEKAVDEGMEVLKPVEDQFTATAPANTKIRTATSGHSPLTSKTFRPKK